MDAGRCAGAVRRWWWLFLLGALFALASYGVALRVRGDDGSATIYRTTATIFVSTAAAPEPPLAFGADSGQQIDRLVASYAEMVEGPLVAERLAAFLRRGAEAEALRRRIDADVVPGTQLISVEATGFSPEETALLASGVSNAFIALHDEKALPGAAQVYEVAPAVAVPQEHTSPFVTYAAVVLAGVLAAASVLVVYERFGRQLRSLAGVLGATSVEERIDTPKARQPRPRRRPAARPPTPVSEIAVETEGAT